MRVYKTTLHLPNGAQLRGFFCKGRNKAEARKDALRQALRIWPQSGKVAKVGGLRWVKGRDA